VALTTTQIKALKPKAKRYDVSIPCEDGEGNPVPGGQLRIYPNGRKVFRDRNNGDPITIGPFPAITLSTFHERLKENHKLRGRGIDPKEHQKQQKIATDRAKAAAAAALTVEQLAAEFVAEYVRKRHKDPRQCERLLNAEILGTEAKPKWRYRKVSELTLRDAVLLTRAIDERAPAVANDTVSLIKKLWRFGASQGHDIDAKEMADLEKQNPEEPRERALDVDEVRKLWMSLDELRSMQPGGTLKKGREDRRGTREEPRLSRAVAIGLKLLLVTAQRRGELLKARWSDIDLDKKLWTIPEAHLKTAKKRRKKADGAEDENRREKAHRVPLSELAIELLRELKDEQAEQNRESACVFPTAHSKRLGDAPMEEKSLTRAAARNQCGLEHWTPHDLRRTAATHMNRLGINFIWVEKVLNHKLQGMLKVYNKHPYEDEKRAALNQWASELQRIVAGESNVVALGERHAAKQTAA
jgi:integrase